MMIITTKNTYINSKDATTLLYNDNVINAKTINAMLEIIKFIKAFDGDIYDNIIYNWRIQGIMRNEPICFRIDHFLLMPFISSLSISYQIIDNFSIPKFHSYIVKSRNKDFDDFYLNAFIVNKRDFKKISCWFDISLLTEDSSSMYIRYIPQSMKYIPDKITYLKEKVCAKQFGIIDKYLSTQNTPNIINCIDNAILLVNDGWIMNNDLYNNIWSINKCKETCEDNICSICQDQIQTEDIILNTACKHKFHWICCKDQGLKTWINQGRTECPMCRSFMF